MSSKNKTLIRRILYQLEVLILVLALVKLLSPEIVPITKVYAAESVKLNKTKVTIEVGKSYTLKLSGTKEKATWTSSNTKIAKVNQSGKITGVKNGSATITATVGKTKYTCKVTVKQSEYKVQSKGQTEVQTHQEIMNSLNMTILKTFTKVKGDIYEETPYGPSSIGYGDISNLVEIKLGYFTDKNKIKYYIVAITNTSKKAFEDGMTLSYSSEEGSEASLSLKYIQPGETRFYYFGCSSKDTWGTYIDHDYFKGLTFYHYQFQKYEDYEDVRKSIEISSKEDKSSYGNYLYMELMSTNKNVKDYDWDMLIFYIDEKGKLYDIKSTDSRWDDNKSIYLDSYDKVPPKVIIAVNYIVKSTMLEIDDFFN